MKRGAAAFFAAPTAGKASPTAAEGFVAAALAGAMSDDRTVTSRSLVGNKRTAPRACSGAGGGNHDVGGDDDDDDDGDKRAGVASAASAAAGDPKRPRKEGQCVVA